MSGDSIFKLSCVRIPSAMLMQNSCNKSTCTCKLKMLVCIAICDPQIVQICNRESLLKTTHFDSNVTNPPQIVLSNCQYRYTIALRSHFPITV